MKVVLDPVHGYIELDDLVQDLLSTPQMQRLRRIKQLGFSNLVYPGANHSRFEHSLGTMHLASTLTRGLDSIEEDKKTEIKAAALLHDIGHGPFSHVTENVIDKYTRRRHDDVKEILGKVEIREVLSKYGISPGNLVKHIKGETSLGQILSSEIDVDRMDYLVRDARYTGVAFGVVDYNRLIKQMNFYEDRLVVDYGGLKAAESLLVSRFWMNTSVYYHHVTRISEVMCSRAVEYMIENNELDPFKLRQMDDIDLVASMRNATGYAGELSRLLDARKLYKRALYVGLAEVGKAVLRHRGRIRRVEKEIAELAGVNPEYVLVDIPKTPEMLEMQAMIKTDHKIIPLNEASHFVSILQEAQMDNWRMGVYSPKEYCEAVGKAARDYFDVKKPLKQFKLSDI
ncbi:MULTISPECIES: HD domain-containing protein [Methanosarcina]|uniref:Putative dNTP triphosphohydrolase, Archaeal subgroup n=1 Tax=Methanosarcina vacuolata Z-761 TaxID=1434123 RepID=A0A0E3Q879_9EURY|nr:MULTISPECIES: HD domain-containing protein [Methanosarcina]AKB44829.1 Putative dNTP triphosphohydrolase, Archaeal subgroup [Methanosarcina vacuolata Z-761]AKB48345.1 Putative dNTP triphosphohydrolase, Archaeal subgroup [Methanosarcina sp. Kolksee]